MASMICVMDAALGRLPQGDGHLQRSGRQVALHTIADGPANDAPGMQIKDDGEVKPALLGPDIADVTGPFLVRVLCGEVPIQQVRRDVEAVVAARGRLEFLVSLHGYAVLAHQHGNTTMTGIQAQFFQFFRHTWSAIAGQ